MQVPSIHEQCGLRGDEQDEEAGGQRKPPEGGRDTGGLFGDQPHNTKPRLLLADIVTHKLDDVKYGMLQLDAILDLEPDNTDALKATVTVLSQYKKYNKETEEKF